MLEIIMTLKADTLITIHQVSKIMIIIMILSKIYQRDYNIMVISVMSGQLKNVPQNRMLIQCGGIHVHVYACTTNAT